MNDSYRNPFSGVNAVQLDPDSILEYWCNPFSYDLFSEIKEEDIFEDRINIVFMGGRSTGKSMFLRYWSYRVQMRAAERANLTLREVFKRNKGIGLYFRVDGPMLKSFQGYGLEEEHWRSVFTHYFELIVGRQFVEVLQLLQTNDSIRNEIKQHDFVRRVCTQLDLDVKSSLEELAYEFDDRIQEVDRFRGNVAFFKEPFRPIGRAFASQSISFGIAEMMIETLPFFKDLNIVFLLDEYENFLKQQQVVINTLLKFTRPQIKFRIGMRLEGFRTFGTIDEEDFIMEGREYRKVVFEEVLNKDLGYHRFLDEVARKRLEAVPTLKEKGFTEIRSIFSQEENLEQEAVELVKGKPDRAYKEFLKRVPRDRMDLVRYQKNPLMELLNFIWLERGVAPEKTLKAMQDYLSKRRTDDAAKYRLDYVDKYKLSLMFLLCSIYKKPKQYYSFNTFAFLSSGIVGNFIELCRRAFAIAGWEDEQLETLGRVSKSFQSQAARDFSTDQLHQISRIEDYGGQISRFVKNIGNVFRDYHLDPKLRYPETNQFAMDLDSIQDRKLGAAMKAAIKWSVIQRKPNLQSKNPGEHLEDLYTINRIFAPSFQISYRTRGGKSISLTEQMIADLMESEDVDTSQYMPRRTPVSESSDKAHPSLFPDE
ncbi:MAG: hypothetical protein WAQ99_10805 [Pyrinomonadaceae bacterium]